MKGEKGGRYQGSCILVEISEELLPGDDQELIHDVVLEGLYEMAERMSGDLNGMPERTALFQRDVDVLEDPGSQSQLQDEIENAAVVVHDLIAQDQIQRPADAVAQRETVEGLHRIALCLRCRNYVFDVEAQTRRVAFVRFHRVQRPLQDEIHRRDVDQLQDAAHPAQPDFNQQFIG